MLPSVQSDFERLRSIRKFWNLFSRKKDEEIYLSPYHRMWWYYPDFASIVFGERKPHVHVYLSVNNTTFTPSHLNIPIFPPGEKNIRAYTQCMELFGGNLKIIVYDESFVWKDVKTVDIGDLHFFDVDFEIFHAHKTIQFKLNQNWSAAFISDTIRIISYYSNLYSYFSLIDGVKSELCDTIVHSIFKPLDTQREMCWLGWNLGRWKVRWIARVLDRDNLWNRTEWFNRFDDGDIIIAHSTDVYYMSYIFRAGGIITENANLLSHASLISRELWIPLVLGVENIFMNIFSGDTIELDSDTGAITILKRFWED